MPEGLSGQALVPFPGRAAALSLGLVSPFSSAADVHIQLNYGWKPAPSHGPSKGCRSPKKEREREGGGGGGEGKEAFMRSRGLIPNP